MIKPITNHIHPVTVEELETIHAHVTSSIAKEREAYTSGQEANANLFELVAASMPERSTNVLCNIDLSAPIEQLQAEIAALRSWAHGNDETAHQPADMIKALTNALDDALEWIDAVPSEMPLPAMPGFDRDDVNNLLKEAKAVATTAHQMTVGLSHTDSETIKLALAIRYLNMGGMAEEMRKDMVSLAEKFNRPEHVFSFESLCNALSADLNEQQDESGDRLATLLGLNLDDAIALSKEAKSIPGDPTPAANFFVKFIAGNPAIFSKIRTSPYLHTTLEEAMSDLSTIEGHGWRGWIEDRDGSRVKETATETLWAAKNEHL